MKPVFLLFCFLCSAACVQAQDFNQIIKAVAPDRAKGDLFGYSVSISDNYAIVGAYGQDTSPSGNNPITNAGAAYIYRRNNSGNWVFDQKLVAADRTTPDSFGASVAISGNYAIVGAPNKARTAASITYEFAGAAYIFERGNNGTWTQVKKVVADVWEAQDYFGTTVAISGSYAMVSSYLEGATNLGKAYIYERNGGTWAQAQKVAAHTTGNPDFFGISMAMSGNYALIGSHVEKYDAMESNPVNDAGAAYLFERGENGVWTQKQKLVANNRRAGDRFGWSVDIEDSYIVVGAYYQDRDANEENPKNHAGAAYIFEPDNSGVWVQVEKLAADDRKFGDEFGYAVTISGNYAVVGAHFESEDENGEQTKDKAGSAYVFERGNDGSWTQSQKIVAGDRGIDDEFGISVSLSGNYLLVGAFHEDPNAAGGGEKKNAGAAYLFELTTPTAGNKTELLAPSTLQVAPNPFSTETNIRFQTEVATKANVSVFSLDGKEVAKLLNEEVKGGQTYNLTFDGSHLPTGVYLLHLSTENGEVQQQKLVINR